MAMDSNPYRAPDAPIGTRAEARAFAIAGKWRRFGTYVIDIVCYFACMFVAGILLALTLGEEGVQGLGLLVNVISFGVMFAYYVLFEALFARTPGKWICGTMVVDQGGGPPSFGQVLGRTACRLIPFEPLSFLGERGWHDGLSKTSVVSTR